MNRKILTLFDLRLFTLNGYRSYHGFSPINSAFEAVTCYDDPGFDAKRKTGGINSHPFEEANGRSGYSRTSYNFGSFNNFGKKGVDTAFPGLHRCRKPDEGPIASV